MMQAAILATSRPENLLALAAAGTALGLYWFYKGFRLLQRKRLILNTPASKVRSASMGLVEISGLAAGPYVLNSPLKQAECYYYRSTAWQLKQRGKNTEWVKVAEETLHVPFYVDDNTGKVLVDPRGAEMDLHCDLSEQYHRSILFSGPEMPEWVAEFLTRYGVDPDKRIKVEEYCIKPKNFLFVLGTLSQNPGLDASIRPAWAERAGQRFVAPVKAENTDAPHQIIRLSAETNGLLAAEMTQQQKIAAALVKAGISNPAAWSAAAVKTQPAAATIPQPAATVQARTAPAVQRKAESEDAKGFDLHPPVVLMQGSHQPAFFISWRSQRDVVQSLGWKSSLMIWGGPAMTLISVYFLLAYFRWL
jgi:E3 Ubiquitin ligase